MHGFQITTDKNKFILSTVNKSCQFCKGGGIFMFSQVIKFILRDKVSMAIIIITVIVLTIAMLNCVRVLIEYGILTLKLKTDKKKILNNIYLVLLSFVYKPLNYAYIICHKIALIMKIDMHILYSITITILISFSFVKSLYIVVYLIFKSIFYKSTLAKDVYAYLSLAFILITVSYFPDKVCLWMQYVICKFINKISHKRHDKKIISVYENELNISKKIIILLRPKLWIYLSSIFFTVISSLEKISNSVIITNPFWLQIKPIAFEAVFTMIVVDSFINLFISEYKKIRDEANVVLKGIKAKDKFI